MLRGAEFAHGSDINAPCDLEQDLNQIWGDNFGGLLHGDGCLGPTWLPWPQALQAQEQTPSSLFSPGLGGVYRQDSWAHRAPRPRAQFSTAWEVPTGAFL